ncbi:Cu+-exporting ATPase [Flavobacteriaceae bacterium MAR_2010_72]|nr:Cu+-exporting ATPase [Flavobacteriaceae bacterium MAR_2010_72]TVZ58406.1 Cu+-exporting ATPase [Flavobacteriaceae bacterium MAR_2010_105]
MNAFKNILLVIVTFALMVACKNEAKPELKTIETEETSMVANTLDQDAVYTKAEFGIEGMSCAIGCAKTIEKKLAKLDGVKSVKVDFNKELAMVEYDQAKVTRAALTATVTKAGEVYKVKNMKTVDAFSNE